ncbi:hypothetical protein E2320_020283, partial [Naja naja]
AFYQQNGFKRNYLCKERI